MKKILITAIFIVVFVLYSIYHNAKTSVSSSGIGVSTNGVSANVAYKDGTYTGSASDAFYGTIQVRAVIQKGKIADVLFLQYPSDRNESVQINQQAMPQLKQETIQTQSATVDIVSGATDSSQAFMHSLAAALVQAK